MCPAILGSAYIYPMPHRCCYHQFYMPLASSPLAPVSLQLAGMKLSQMPGSVPLPHTPGCVPP